MKLKIFYAACIAVIALSCGNDKMQGLRTPSNDITLAKPEGTKPAGLVNEKISSQKIYQMKMKLQLQIRLLWKMTQIKMCCNQEGLTGTRK